MEAGGRRGRCGQIGAGHDAGPGQREVQGSGQQGAAALEDSDLEPPLVGT